MFFIGLLAGLVAGVLLWLPMTIGIAGIMLEILQLPRNLSADASLLVMIALYAIWLLLVLATVRLMGWLPFFHGLLCSIPLPTILIDYAWQLSLSSSIPR